MAKETNNLDLEALAAFNAESLKAYGSGNIKLAKEADGRWRFVTENDMFRLTDEFDGGNPFCGITRIIRKSDNAAVWNSYYHGWLTDEASKLGLSPELIFNFMRLALQHPDSGSISRGPAVYIDKTRALRYTNRVEGSGISCFYGQEAVFYNDNPEPVYICRHGGGLVNQAIDAGEASTQDM